MNDDAVDLDKHRGMAAQKATELRRLLREVADDQARLKDRQDALEDSLNAAPAANWTDAAERVRYLLSLFGDTQEAQDPRRKTLIANVLRDIERLLAGSPDDPADTDLLPTNGE